MKTKIILIALSALFTTISFSQKYDYVPKEHSNKWIDGNEWNIVTNNNVTVKIFIAKENSMYLTVRLFVKNNSDNDINVFPENIYYKAKEINESLIYTSYEDEDESENEEDCLKRLNSNQFPINQKEVLLNSKTLTFLGYLFDIKSAGINRLHRRTDILKETLLYKNTVEPTKELDRIVVFQSSSPARELEFHLIISGEVFVFNFEKEFIKNK